MGVLSGEVAWVTGAGTGIGRAIAVALAKEGAAVGLSGRNRETLSVTEALVQTSGGKPLVAVADVSNAEQVAAAHAAIVEKLGHPGILVNNAGWNVAKRHWRDLTAETVGQMVGTNLTGPFLCTLAVLPMMRERHAGLLVHVASISATGIFLVSGPAYTATKYAARAMSATLNAEEGIHNIRSVCINPGEVETPLLDRRPAPPTAEQRALMVQPEDIAAAVLFCARLPSRACVTEMTIAPTDNNFYRADAHAIADRD
jgi:NADP-dependent 3-hydroxy acid dehydrogenase YdfG